jgi:hypothetical protein
MKILEITIMTIGTLRIVYGIFSSLRRQVISNLFLVGYGDYFPKTNLGRGINIMASLIGSALISLMVINLQNSLKFQDHEQKAFEAKEKLEFKQDLEFKAAQLFKATFDYLKIKKKYKQALHNPISERKLLVYLKKKLETSIYKRIEIKKDFKYAMQ